MAKTALPAGPAPAPAPAANCAGPAGSDPTWCQWIDPKAWEVYLLTQLAWPITHTTVSAMDAWTLSEDPTGNMNGGFNPFAVSGLFPGATKCVAQCGGGSPIMAYATLQDGLNATVAFIKNNGYNSVGSRTVNGKPEFYSLTKNNNGTIGAAFLNANFQAESRGAAEKVGGLVVGNVGLLSGIWASINSTGWCGGCQGGKYPVALSDLLNGVALNAKGLAQIGGNATRDLLQGTPITDYSASQQGAVTPTSILPSPSEIASLLGLSGFNWGAIGLFAAGGALFVVGLVVLLNSTTTGKNVEGAAKVAAAA